MANKVKFSLVIRCENDGAESTLTVVEATSPQQALDLMMSDLKQVVEEYDEHPDINYEG